MNTQHTVCALSEISSGSVKRVVIGDVAIALVRIDDKVYAIGDRCAAGRFHRLHPERG